MSLNTLPPKHSVDEYEIHHAQNNDETRQLWWPNMLEVQWNRGPADLATYMDHSRSKGMLLAYVKGTFTPVGHVAAVINDNSTGWVAMFIVKAEYRGLRLGAALWNSMMQDVQNLGCEYIGLDAVPQQKLTYERRGFVDSKIGVVKFMTRSLGAIINQKIEASVQLLPVQSVDSLLLAEFERKYTGFYRPALWRKFVERVDVLGVVAITSTSVRSLEDIAGFTMIRRAPMGVRLSPLYAETASIAEVMLSAVLSESNLAYIRQHPMEDYPLHELDDTNLSAQAIICTEMWTGNSSSEPIFAQQGWTEAGVFHRMWLNDKATPEQSDGGLAAKGLFCIFDAAIG